MDIEVSIRFECLRLALSHGDYETGAVLSRAKAYSDFTLHALVESEQSRAPQHKCQECTSYQA